MAPKLVTPQKGKPARPPILKLSVYLEVSLCSSSLFTSSQQREVATMVVSSAYPAPLRAAWILSAKSPLLIAPANADATVASTDGLLATLDGVA